VLIVHLSVRARPRETRYSRATLLPLRLLEPLTRIQTFLELNQVRTKLSRLPVPLDLKTFASVVLILSIQMYLLVVINKLLENAHKILSTVTCLELLPKTQLTERSSVEIVVEPKISLVVLNAIIAVVMNRTNLLLPRKLKRKNLNLILDLKLPIRERLLSCMVVLLLPTVLTLRKMVRLWVPELTGETLRSRLPTWHLPQKVLTWTEVLITRTRNIRICNHLLLVILKDLLTTKTKMLRSLLPLTLTGRPRLVMLDPKTRAQPTLIPSANVSNSSALKSLNRATTKDMLLWARKRSIWTTLLTRKDKTITFIPMYCPRQPMSTKESLRRVRLLIRHSILIRHKKSITLVRVTR